jgi:hypothetical protein
MHGHIPSTLLRVQGRHPHHCLCAHPPHARMELGRAPAALSAPAHVRMEPGHATVQREGVGARVDGPLGPKGWGKGKAGSFRFFFYFEF